MNSVLFRFCVLTVAGWIHSGQQNAIEYLMAENRVLREQLGGRRLRLTDDQRRAVLAKASQKRRTWRMGILPASLRGCLWGLTSSAFEARDSLDVLGERHQVERGQRAQAERAAFSEPARVAQERLEAAAHVHEALRRVLAQKLR